MEAEETAVARQRLDRHVFAAADTHATVEELLKSVFSMRSVLRLYSGDLREKLLSIPCGGGVEYLHRCPARRRRQGKGNSVLGV
jgi:hypothetical protein